MPSVWMKPTRDPDDGLARSKLPEAACAAKSCYGSDLLALLEELPCVLPEVLEALESDQLTSRA
jgi:hypothetical protein